MLPMRGIQDLIEDIATQNEDAWSAIEQCTVRLPESGPILRAALARVADHGHETDAEANVAFAALHILGGRRDPLSCPAFLKLLRRPADELEDLLGDAKTETLPLIAASVFDGDAAAYFDAIMDRRIDDLIRYGLFGVVAFLTWENRIDRATTIRFLERFDEERGAEAGEVAWSGWELAISLLGLRDLASRAAAAFRDERIFSGFGNHAEFLKTLAHAEAAPDDITRFEDERLGYIEDVLVAMEQFSPRGSEDFGSRPMGDHTYEDLIPYFPPATNPWRNVGRNDPCPCGSGKKFKKCCLEKR